MVVPIPGSICAVFWPLWRADELYDDTPTNPMIFVVAMLKHASGLVAGECQRYTPFELWDCATPDYRSNNWFVIPFFNMSFCRLRRYSRWQERLGVQSPLLSYPLDW
jgi:hypothetical protein